MLADNLVMLRNLKGLTQEQVAEVTEYPDNPMQSGNKEKLFPI